MKYALVTVYFPDECAVHKIATIIPQVDKTIVCDNTPMVQKGAVERIKALGNVDYVCFGANLGLSAAFNRILKDRSYLWNPKDYIFFFDQDSVIESGHVEKMIFQFEQLRIENRDVGCLGPVYYNASSKTVEEPRCKHKIASQVYSVSSIITSSMLTTYAILEQVGFWNEKIFLDMADWDLCWRIQAAGHLCCLTNAVILQHCVGQGEKKLGPLRLRIGSPVREYYQIRDCLQLLFQSYTPLKYRARFCAMITIRSPLHLLFLDHRKERFRYMLHGLLDYSRRKTGAWEEKENVYL